jgi:hypothetical protein
VQSATRAFAWHWSRKVECATLDHHFLLGLHSAGAGDGPAEQVRQPVRHVELGGRGSGGLLRPGRFQLAVPMPRIPIVSVVPPYLLRARAASQPPPRVQLCFAAAIHLSST